MPTRTFIAQVTFCLLPGLGGAWFAVKGEQLASRLVGIVAVFAFGIVGIRLILQRRHRLPRLIIRDEGLYDRSLGTPLIPWTSIAGARVVPFFGSPFLMLGLIDEVERIRMFSLVRRLGVYSNRVFGLSAFTMNPNGLDVPVGRVLEAIGERLVAAGLTANDGSAETNSSK